MSRGMWPALLVLLNLLSHLCPALAQTQNVDANGYLLADDRVPSLFTANYGDCQGDGSLINVTRFNAAYYKDNMTVVFHLGGTSNLQGVAIMMYIGVFAYGENRFDLIFNPCSANINSACPLNSSIPLDASGAIPVSQADVAGIPDIAYSIPDFEGEAILRIFSNVTRQQIGCYAGVVTNGNTFSQPESVGTVLGIFTFVAMLSSFATAIYGEIVPTIRLHYAHSLSVGVVFAVWQHIFYTGALSVNWPSVLPAWWSNFAWAGGMIYSSSMQNSINNFIGNRGDPLAVGAAGSGSSSPTLGGANAVALIYKRALKPVFRRAAEHPLFRDVASEIYTLPHSVDYKRHLMHKSVERAIQKRGWIDPDKPFQYYGQMVPPGLPLPGNFSGFAGTLSQENIPASNAFLTGLMWFLILLAAVVAAVIAFKSSLEASSRFKLIKHDRLRLFRQRWIAYTAAVALRTCYLAFFMIMFLAVFQFTYQGSSGAVAVAAVVFAIFLFGVPGIAIYACIYKKSGDEDRKLFGKVQVERKMLLGRVPWFGISKSDGQDVQARPEKPTNSDSFLPPESQDTVSPLDQHSRNIHDDEDFTVKFGWLASRFRRSRWWFFAAWLVYEFLRAVFYGGASGHALVQVFGLLVIELFAFVFLLWARPYEGRRLNFIVVYCLSISKIASVALAAAFDVQFNLPRIITTALGIVLIVIQGILTLITMGAVIAGVVSSYFSIARNREDFRPRRWANRRDKYFDSMDKANHDLPAPPKPKKEKKKTDEEAYVEPHFEIQSVRRLAKIQDGDDDTTSIHGGLYDPNASHLSVNSRGPTPAHSRSGSVRSITPLPGRSRTASLQSVNRPAAAVGPSRLSWSTTTNAEEPSTTIIDDAITDDGVHAVPAPPQPAKRVSHRLSSRSFSLQNQRVRSISSVDSLAHSIDMGRNEEFAHVPPPFIRPRSGTIGSRPASRAASFHGAIPGQDTVSALPNTFSHSHRGRNHPLTPAQEADEFTITPAPARI